MDQEKFRGELYKRIFRVLLKDYDDDTMEFSNPEHEKAGGRSAQDTKK